MPTYDYICSNCGRTSEIVHSINAGPPSACPSCGAVGTLRKAFNPPTIHFKGSGWAKKDRSGGHSRPARSGDNGASGGSGSGSESGSDARHGSEGDGRSSSDSGGDSSSAKDGAAAGQAKGDGKGDGTRDAGAKSDSGTGKDKSAASQSSSPAD